MLREPGVKAKISHRNTIMTLPRNPTEILTAITTVKPKDEMAKRVSVKVRISQARRAKCSSRVPAWTPAGHFPVKVVGGEGRAGQADRDKKKTCSRTRGFPSKIFLSCILFFSVLSRDLWFLRSKETLLDFLILFSFCTANEFRARFYFRGDSVHGTVVVGNWYFATRYGVWAGYILGQKLGSASQIVLEIMKSQQVTRTLYSCDCSIVISSSLLF